MQLKKYLIPGLFAALSLVSCNDDDDAPGPIPERDRGEQAIEDDEAIQQYLATHFYNYEDFENPSEGFDYSVSIDTIAGDNSDKTSLADSENLMVKTVTQNEVDYKLYILKIREGEGEQPTFADSTFVRYRGELLNRTTFDQSPNPVWFDLPGFIGMNSNGQLARRGGVIPGFQNSLNEFKAATGYTVNSDNTVTWNNDYGIGIVIMPSGLGYFSQPQASIPPYSPLVFVVNLMRMNEADHDGDGIPSWMEDLDGDGNLFNDDTDGDGIPNHSDRDDDGDGTPTREEIIIHEDGTLEFPDSNGNGIPDYLDPDTFK
ncbi:FKBP-type peptidyl-prolyl cis-trans isomerase [Salegentibacter sp. HM20]